MAYSHAQLSCWLFCILLGNLWIRTFKPMSYIWISQKRLTLSIILSFSLSWEPTYGVAGNLLSWLTNYLQGRAQRVVIDGAASEWAPVNSGVPQGSLLGQLLFTIFINDLPEEALDGVKVALYADDTKVYKPVKSIDDCISLQSTLTNMQNWSERNNISFNASKCKPLSVTRKKSPPGTRIQSGCLAARAGAQRKRPWTHHHQQSYMECSHPHHLCQGKQAIRPTEADLPVASTSYYQTHTLLVSCKISIDLRNTGMVTWQSHFEGASGACPATGHKVDPSC